MLTARWVQVGNPAFYQYVDAALPTSYRVTHNADPVPHLPPKLFGFHHLATEVFYNLFQQYKWGSRACRCAADRQRRAAAGCATEAARTRSVPTAFCCPSTCWIILPTWGSISRLTS